MGAQVVLHQERVQMVALVAVVALVVQMYLDGLVVIHMVLVVLVALKWVEIIQDHLEQMVVVAVVVLHTLTLATITGKRVAEAETVLYHLAGKIYENFNWNIINDLFNLVCS
jgi:hypothetical protein